MLVFSPPRRVIGPAARVSAAGAGYFKKSARVFGTELDSARGIQYVPPVRFRLKVYVGAADRDRSKWNGRARRPGLIRFEPFGTFLLSRRLPHSPVSPRSSPLGLERNPPRS